MQIVSLRIENFRGIKEALLSLKGHTAIVGDNNSGKSTILEAIDLVLGPERLSRQPVINEHDFYGGKYIDIAPIKITIVVIIVDLNEDQQRYFRDHVVWYDQKSDALIEGPPESTASDSVLPALKIGFEGEYNLEDDDFVGRTSFFSRENEDGSRDPFGQRDKRLCGFLYLRTVRTARRALSLERGSLLDVILRLQELRPQMWEDVLKRLRDLSVAEDPTIGVAPLLDSIQKAVRAFVPLDWSRNPHLRVTNLTREELRKALTVFIGTGILDADEKEYAVPFQHQGTGTINVIVLALLTIIAELKQNVIFAMEEPEIAIPPQTQKRIVRSIVGKSSQAIFTSHSPYVLEEFSPSSIMVIQKMNGVLKEVKAEYPPAVKPKKYKEEFRRKFCEALMARRVLIIEGRTEFDAIPSVARRLEELNPIKFAALEGLGIAIINAESDSQLAPLGSFFSSMGKVVFAIFDKQESDAKAEIEGSVHHPFESTEKGFERTVINGLSELTLRRLAADLVYRGRWPPHLASRTPSSSMTHESLKESMFEFLKHSKGDGDCSDLLVQCDESEMPRYLISVINSIKHIVEST